MNKIPILLIFCAGFIVISCIEKTNDCQEVDYCMPIDSISLGLPKEITPEDIENDTLGLYSHEGLIENDVL